MNFAFLIMGDFNSETDRASIHNGTAQIIGVANVREASIVAKKLYENGIYCIELCGAFKIDDVRKIVEVTENRIPIGYITNLPEQEELFKLAFSK